ncbi:MAG TPA: hypothetical protein VLU43_02900 [Anaeromyxobacteraceae bacterium]|nr:hypothetical protein [Anaeromyxobacteraceae bacterium]
MADAKGMVPQGESLRRALKWLSDRRLEDPAAPRGKLVDEAAVRFDLSPVETEFLLTRWKEEP